MTTSIFEKSGSVSKNGDASAAAQEEAKTLFHKASQSQAKAMELFEASNTLLSCAVNLCVAAGADSRVWV